MTQVTCTIDGKEVVVPKGTTILEAAKTVGSEIPHYCYHPGLSIAGNCRMCLTEVEKMPKPVIGCQATVSEGMVIHTQSEKVIKMRKSIMEFLLINHPLDCPTCDQAGECRLQDYYMTYDEVPSRFKEQKVAKDKMVDLGADVMLDQERCIACTRCIRVCQEVAHQDEIALANRGDRVTITTFPGKKLSNPYAGNTVDVCPVGALTSKDFRFKKRVWMLKETPSICPGCSRGCNISIHHADRHVYRLKPRENMEVNKYWMCDEGRSGYKFINDKRLLRPQIKVEGHLQEVSLNEATNKLFQLIQSVPTQEIAVVAHSWESIEVLSCLKEFAVKILKTNLLFASQNEVENPYSDKILMTKDKNPNQKAIEELGFQPLEKIKNAKGIIVLNNLSNRHLKLVKEKQIPIFALMASNLNEVMDEALVMFAIPTYAEQSGHFINIDGRKQKFEKAFEPKGESKPVLEILQILDQSFKTRAAS